MDPSRILPATDAAPQAPYFDKAYAAWVVTRYADVLAALRDRRLGPLAADGEDQSRTRDEAGRLRVRPLAIQALAPAQIAQWETLLIEMAEEAAARLATGVPVDLLGAFGKPWCLDVALLVLGRPASERARLAELSERVFVATGAPNDSPLRPPALAATAELELLFQNGPMPMGEPTFVATSQTLPRLMASGWLALIAQPGAWTRLRSERSLLPEAADEMLRHSGIVRRVWRRATETIELGGIAIAAGDRLMLMLAAANRDGAQFADPERLDLSRLAGGHVALGSGRNSCVGAGLIHAAFIAATGALTGRFAAAELCALPDWQIGSGYCFPKELVVRLGG